MFYFSEEILSIHRIHLRANHKYSRRHFDFYVVVFATLIKKYMSGIGIKINLTSGSST